MDLLVGKLLIPFASVLVVSAIGIVALGLSARSTAETADAGETVGNLFGGSAAGRFLGDTEAEAHRTLVVDRSALREIQDTAPRRPRDLHDMRGPDPPAATPLPSPPAPVVENVPPERARPFDLIGRSPRPSDDPSTFAATEASSPLAKRDIFEATRPTNRDRPPSMRDSGEHRIAPPSASPDQASVPQRSSPAEAGDAGAAGSDGLEAVGVNIVLQQPVQAERYVTLPGRLEVVYGNFSPRDPREIPFLWPAASSAVPSFVFSKSAGDGVGHIQLNHYTITPSAQAELRYQDGRHTLLNLVDGDEIERYQIRVNGVAMGLGEQLALHSGDIISMGIYRLKLTI